MKKISLMLMALVVALTMSANNFVKVTSEPTDWSGQYLLAYDADSILYVFNGKDEADGYTNAKAVNDTISSEDLDDYVVEFATMTGGYSFKWLASGKYMSGSSGANSLSFVASAAVNTIDFNNEDTVEIKCNSAFFVFNSTKGQMRFRYFGKQSSYDPATYKRLALYKVEKEIKPEEWTPDTLSVSEARQLIDEKSPLMNKSHYVYGVVTNSSYGSNWPGWAMIWMNDIENPQDSLEGYKIYKDANSTKWTSAEEIPCGLGDTIMLFADGLTLFDGKIYETTSGYYVKTLGQAKREDANDIFKYGIGALEKGSTGTGKYKFDIIISKEEENPDNAVHFIINSTKEKGIAGAYSIYGNGADSSFIDGEGGIAGRITIAYKDDAGANVQYNIQATFQNGGKIYTLNKDFELSGWKPNFASSYTLVDDKPFIPKDGDTITCEQALSYANYLGTLVSPLNVYVRGYVVSNPTSSQYVAKAFNFYINDDPAAKSGIAQSYFCVAQNTDTVKKGDEVLLYGAIQLFNGVAEIKDGTFYSLTATGLEDVKAVANKAGARKVMLNGKMYILKDGVLYNALGAAVQ